MPNGEREGFNRPGRLIRPDGLGRRDGRRKKNANPGEFDDAGDAHLPRRASLLQRLRRMVRCLQEETRDSPHFWPRFRSWPFLQKHIRCHTRALTAQAHAGARRRAQEPQNQTFARIGAIRIAPAVAAAGTRVGELSPPRAGDGGEYCPTATFGALAIETIGGRFNTDRRDSRA